MGETIHRQRWLLSTAILFGLGGSDVALAQTTTEAPSHGQAIEEVVVTATRRVENVQKVPLSISAFSDVKMDVLGVKNFAQLAKFTPGVTYDPDTNNVYIRGIDSTAGSGTTGIYIDDTPIQVRNLGFSSNNTLPSVFDLQRVEVLRGPQGTLFGAGSEGGTVRYIMTQPSLTDYSGIARSELEFTQDGQPSYEEGAAFGGPVVDDVLGFRVSGWYRRDGGWIDQVNYRTGLTTVPDANSTDTYVLRGALASDDHALHQLSEPRQWRSRPVLGGHFRPGRRQLQIRDAGQNDRQGQMVSRRAQCALYRRFLRNNLQYLDARTRRTRQRLQRHAV